MALNGRDPGMFEIVRRLETEERANEFAVANGLLPDVPGVFDFANRPHCTLTPNCNGSLYQTSIQGNENSALRFLNKNIVLLKLDR